MCEIIEGSYAFTILDNSRNLYLVKGSSPLAILHDKRLKLYIYASTHEILWQGITGSSLFNRFRSNLFESSKEVEEINALQGEILRIAPDGSLEYQNFKVKEDYWILRFRNYSGYRLRNAYNDTFMYGKAELEYIEQLKDMASFIGYDGDLVENLLDEGYQLDEIEEFLYSESLSDEICEISI